MSDTAQVELRSGRVQARALICTCPAPATGVGTAGSSTRWLPMASAGSPSAPYAPSRHACIVVLIVWSGVGVLGVCGGRGGVFGNGNWS